jgi:hypothetical protein
MFHYKYFVSTKEGFIFQFYNSDNKNIEESMKSIPDFEENDYWILDACGNKEVLKFYENYQIGFVKIPKKSVERFFAVDAEPPLKFNRSCNLNNILSQLNK